MMMYDVVVVLNDEKRRCYQRENDTIVSYFESIVYCIFNFHADTSVWFRIPCSVVVFVV